MSPRLFLSSEAFLPVARKAGGTGTLTSGPDRGAAQESFTASPLPHGLVTVRVVTADAENPGYTYWMFQPLSDAEARALLHRLTGVTP